MGTKISEFPIASTPLTGAELVPLVQSGGTVKATVNSFSVAAATYISPQFASKLNTTGGAITANSGTAALSITQTGSGDALLVEDSASPDNSPFVISATGAVGIGTTAPATNLDINAGNLASVRLAETNNGVDFRVSASGGSENLGTISTVSNHGIAFKTSSSEKLRIDVDGKVGIGTTAPDRNLVVSGSAASTSILNTDAAATSLVFAPANSTSPIGKIDFSGSYPVRIQTDSVERLRITQTGNVGIGTSSPVTKLDVAGSVALSGSVAALSVANSTADATTLRLSRAQAGFDKKTWELGFLTSIDQDSFVVRAANDALTSFETAFEINKKSTGFGIESIQLFTNGNIQRAIFTSTGSVIFGTPTSTDAFVLASSSSTGAIASRVVNTASTLNSSARLEAYAAGGSSSYGVSVGATYASTSFGLIEAGSFLNGGLRFSNASSSNPFIFQSGGAEIARLTGSGILGLGTTSPTSKLEISNSTIADIKCVSSLVDMRFVAISSNSYGSAGTVSSHDLVLFTANSERMRIDTSGRVGFGASFLSTDNAKLLVYGGSLAVNGSINNFSSTSLQLSYNNGSSTIHAFNSFYGSTIAFNTNAAGSSAVERMRIDSSGNVGIGTTTPTTIGLTIQKSAGNGSGALLYSGSEFGYIDFNSTLGLTLYSSQAAATSPIRFLFAGTEMARVNASANFGLGTSTFGTSATRTLAIASGTAPTTTVAGVGQIYVQSGALVYRGGSGTVTVLAPA